MTLWHSLKAKWFDRPPMAVTGGVMPGLIPIGAHVVDREQPGLAPDEETSIAAFHDLYYRRWSRQSADTINLSWFGHQLLKCPLDLWIYQEILVRTKPDVIVETGTWMGGSALYMAMIMDRIGHGRIISVDIEDRAGRPQHPRITYITSPSTAPEVLDDIRRQVGAQRAMVILDSDHTAPHVYQEMIVYSDLVKIGDYMIVEDTNVNGHPTWPDFGPGPMEAVEKFMAEDRGFVCDMNCERFMMTLNPRGYLKRIR